MLSRSSQDSRFALHSASLLQTDFQSAKMANYEHFNLQGTLKDQQTMCKIMSLERKCSSGVEKLRAILESHLQNGVPSLDIWEKTLSFFTLRKAILFHNGYSRCTRETLRLFPAPEEDVLPLCCPQ